MKMQHYNRIKSYFQRKGKQLIKPVAISLAICLFLWKLQCLLFKLENVICISITGRLANAMFQEAFVFTFAKNKGKPMVIFSSENPLTDIFTLEGLNWKYDSTHLCRCYPKYFDRWDCAFDDQYEKLQLSSKDTVQVFGYFQSWKYLKGYEREIKKLFTFQPSIRQRADKQLQGIIKSFQDKGVTKKTVLVGVHIRRGDYVTEKTFVNFGYNVATETYIHNAVKYFQDRYPDVLFIVCGNDLPWAREVMQKYERTYFVEGNSPSQDMALLTGTHHTLMTVGTFGWWIGWLTNGTTVYYKHTYREGTDFMMEFNGGITDHFPPHWVGLD